MSDTTVTTWTCDRCGATEETPRDKQPEGWLRIFAANPPRHAEPEGYGDLCFSCGLALNRWWVVPPTERADTPASVVPSGRSES